MLLMQTKGGRKYMSILDKLLETDLKKLQNKEKKTYEVKRLSLIHI